MGSAASTAPAEHRAATRWKAQTQLSKVQHRNRRVSHVVSPTEAEIGTKKARELQNTIMKWALDAQVDRRHHDRTSDEDTDSVSTIDSVDLDSLPAPVRRRPPGSQANSQTVGGTSMASSVSGSSRGKKKKRLSVTFTAGGNLQFSRKRSIPKSSTAASDVGGRDNDLDDEFAPEELRAIEDVLGAGGHGQRSNPRSQRDNASNRPETVPESDLEGFDQDEMSIIHTVLGTAGDARQQPCEPARKVSRADSPKNGANSPSVLSGIEDNSDDDLDAEELAIIAAYLGHAPQKPGLREGHPANETTNQHQAAVAPKTSAPAQTAGLGGIFAMSRSKKSRARPWLPPPKSFTPVSQRDDALRSSPSRPEANGVGGAADVQETKFPMTEDVPTDSTEPQSPLHRDRSAFPSASTFAVPDDWNPSEASHSSGVFAVEQDEMGVMHPDLRRALDLITEQSGSVDAWKAKAEGLRLIVVMIDCHTDAVLSVLEQIVAAVCPEITNARASIAKLAIDTASSLCKVAGPALDSSVDSIVCALLKHGAPDKAFVNAAAESALTDVALHMTPEAVFVALLEGLRKKSNKTKALAAHALLTVLERFEPSLVPSFAAEVLPRLPPLLRSPERPAGVTLLKALVVVDGWDDALVDRYLTGDGLHIVLSCMNDMRSSHTKVSPRGKTRSSEPQSSSRDRPSGTYRASSVSSRVSKPTGGSTGGKEWTTLMRIKTEIAQSTDWQKRDAALGILDTELSDPAKYTRHVEIIFRDILLPLTTVSNGKLQLSALEITTKYIAPFKTDLDASLLALIVKKVTPTLASSNSMVFSAASALLDRIVAYCNPALLIKPWCAAIDRERNAKVQTQMLQKLRKLVAIGYTRGCNPQIEKHAIPAACGWLTTGVCSVDTKRLLRILFAEMEPEVLQAVENASQETQRAIVQFMEKDLYA